MKIDRNNYEACFLDYLEGNLDENLVDDFIEFIRQNPDLKKELEVFNSITLKPEEILFDKKGRLFKEIFDNEAEFNRAAVAQMEGDLSAKEKAAFEDYLASHPEKLKETALFNLTKLQPDESVIFSKKNKLYQRSNGKVFILWASRVAAILILAMAVYILIDRPFENTVSNKQVAVVNNEKETVKPAPEKAPIVVEKQSETINTPVETKTEPSEKEDVSSKPEVIQADKMEEPAENEQIAEARIPIEVPKKIRNISPALKNQAVDLTLVSMNRHTQNPAEDRSEDHFLADVVKEKTGLDNLSLNKITKAGLKLVSAISKEKFTYETNNSGKVTEVNFDSRLLAFSIPTGNGEKQ